MTTAWTPFHAQLHRTLRQRQLLPNGCTVLMAVSGGQDSLALAALLRDLQPKWDWHLAIAHCDHRWRSDSAENAAHVLKLMAEWGLTAYGEVTLDPPATEADARHWRYAVLTQLAQSHGYSHVVTGHTASDRAETLLYNLARGSGMEGLQALGWERELGNGIRLVRPLLEFRRSDTARICRVLNLPIWEDSTNRDVRYARNRIRHEVLPMLQMYLNPQVEMHLAQTADILASEVEYLNQQAIALYQTAVDLQTGLPRLHRIVLRDASLALQRRVLRHWLRQFDIHPTFEHTEKCVELITAPNRSQTDPFPGGAIAQVSGDWIRLEQRL